MKIIKNINFSFLTLIFLVLFAFVSCTNEEKCKDCELENTNDTLAKKDTTNSLETALKNDKVESKTVEQKANLAKIEKKYGEQWDFCTCVVANDSINNAFEKTLTSKQETKLMARWEDVELKCKEFLTQPNTTPEERAAHEKKVKKCLRNK
ncbi:MAG: hypothetical protein V4622_10625 [Bacteroidota bacterium]